MYIRFGQASNDIAAINTAVGNITDAVAAAAAGSSDAMQTKHSVILEGTITIKSNTITCAVAPCPQPPPSIFLVTADGLKWRLTGILFKHFSQNAVVMAKHSYKVKVKGTTRIGGVKGIRQMEVKQILEPAEIATTPNTCFDPQPGLLNRSSVWACCDGKWVSGSYLDRDICSKHPSLKIPISTRVCPPGKHLIGGGRSRSCVDICPPGQSNQGSFPYPCMPIFKRPQPGDASKRRLIKRFMIGIVCMGIFLALATR
jgi:hypothetical protein